MTRDFIIQIFPWLFVLAILLNSCIDRELGLQYRTVEMTVNGYDSILLHLPKKES